MDLLFGLALLVVVALPLVYAIRRSTELFVLRVRRGRVEFVRGRVPGALFADVEDIFAGTKANAEIRVVAEGGRARALVRGIEGSLAQRVRNVVGRFHIAEIRAGRRPANRAARRAR
jgi:hypothetical protein